MGTPLPTSVNPQFDRYLQDMPQQYSSRNTAGMILSGGARFASTGDPTQLINGMLSFLLREKAPPPERCNYLLNPLNIDAKGTGALATMMWKGWLSGAKASCSGQENDPFELSKKKERGQVMRPKASQWPFDISAPCDPNDPSEAVKYTIGGWWNKVKDYSFKGACRQQCYGNAWYEDPKTPGTPEELRRCNEAQVMASWAILNPDQFRQRYEMEVGRAIRAYLAESPSIEEVSKIEKFYGGRVVDGVFVWGWYSVDGVRVDNWPLWIPLDSDAKGIRSIYTEAWKYGLTDKSIGQLAKKRPLEGYDAWDTLSQKKKTEVIANGYVIAAAKAGGDPAIFEQGRRIVSSACPSCNITSADIRAALNRLVYGVQREALSGESELATTKKSKIESSVPVTTPATTLASLLIPGIAILGGIVLAKKLKRKRGRKHGR